jgi:hypothetical protein
MDQLDLNGYNYIDRIYKEQTYAPERDRFPRRLMLGTETNHQVHNWLGVRDHDYVIGEFIWTGIDYLGESHAFPRRGSGSGFLDLAGGKKPEFYRRAAYWRDDAVLQLSVPAADLPALELDRGRRAYRPCRDQLRRGRAVSQWSLVGASCRLPRCLCERVAGLFCPGRALGRCLSRRPESCYQ